MQRGRRHVPTRFDGKVSVVTGGASGIGGIVRLSLMAAAR
jgi:hypothetical protein